MVSGQSLALIVEDDRFQREILCEILKGEGLDVIECETAEAAELVIANVGAELKALVTDVGLADVGNGLDLAIFARQQFPYLPVVIVSGQSHVVPPGVRFLAKPYQAAELLRAVNLQG
jgi:CheY-like chemotaxis protein